MNNQMFDPMAMDFTLKQMKQIQKENEQSLRRLFDKMLLIIKFLQKWLIKVVNMWLINYK